MEQPFLGLKNTEEKNPVSQQLTKSKTCLQLAQKNKPGLQTSVLHVRSFKRLHKDLKTLFQKLFCKYLEGEGWGWGWGKLFQDLCSKGNKKNKILVFKTNLVNRRTRHWRFDARRYSTSFGNV